MSVPSVKPNPGISAPPDFNKIYEVLETINSTVLTQLIDVKDNLLKMVMLTLAYLQYYGGVAGIMFFSYLTILLVNTSVSGSAIGFVIQPWLGIAMVLGVVGILFGYLYFVPKPADVVGVDLQDMLPKPPQAPSMPIPGIPGIPGLPGL